MSDAHVRKGNKERLWRMGCLDDRVIGERTRVERQHESRPVGRSRENQGGALLYLGIGSEERTR